MNWTEEQSHEALRRYVRASELGRSGPAAVMDFTAELMAARGGEMTHNMLSQVLGHIAAGASDHKTAQQTANHIAAQGAKVTALESERTALRVRAEKAERSARDINSDRKSISDYSKILGFGRDGLVRELAEARAELARLKSSGPSQEDPRESLRAWLTAMGRTQKDFAAAIGVTESAMSYYLSGRNIPLRAVRRRIEEETGGCVPFGAWPEEERGWNTPHVTMVADDLKPSGQVAEDVAAIDGELSSDDVWLSTANARIALSRLATLAQRGLEVRAALRTILAEHDAEEGPDAHQTVADVRRLVDEGGKTEADVLEQGGTAPGRCWQGTCGHSDASTPGHAARAAERSKAFNEAASPQEVALVRIEEASYDRGAEAMRAACLSGIREALASVGAWGRETERIVTSAIEEATP